jgi:hypothetical protein
MSASGNARRIRVQPSHDKNSLKLRAERARIERLRSRAESGARARREGTATQDAWDTEFWTYAGAAMEELSPDTLEGLGLPVPSTPRKEP